MKYDSFAALLQQVKQCTVCAADLVDGVRPVVQLHSDAKVLIIGQAPGRKVHVSGVPFDDASGDRLRDWMGVTRQTFYNPTLIGIMPMGFCFPGSQQGQNKSGDLPPRKECAPTWHQHLLSFMPNIELTLLVGQYAQQAYLKGDLKKYLTNNLADGSVDKAKTLTETVRQWRRFGPSIIPLPHPSPRNNIWLAKNTWFEDELLGQLRQQVNQALMV